MSGAGPNKQLAGAMRVLFLTNNPNLGSTARILQSWLMLGREQGIEGWVVTQKEGDFPRWLRQMGVPQRTDPMPWPDRRRPLSSLWHAWKVARWARKAGVEVIHCNEHDVYPFAVLLRRFLKRPLVCHVRFRLERPFSEWAFRGARRQPDALLWTSRQQKDDSAAAVEGIIAQSSQHVVHLGLDLTTFGALAAARNATRQAWGVAADEIVIGTASPLRPRKRIEDFVALAAQVASENPKVVGILAGGTIKGDENYRDKIVQQIKETGLGRRLQWVGNLEPIEPFYHAVDVSISTSEYETFGNSVCEAMACSCPVAAYRGGSIHEVVGDTGPIVETGDLPALTAAVRDLVRSPEARADCGRRGRQRVAEEFNPARSLQQLRQIYQSVLPR
jgi:glycosyltransferase involved in cell wall biosynthesis